jgi:hypothetical protein
MHRDDVGEVFLAGPTGGRPGIDNRVLDLLVRQAMLKLAPLESFQLDHIPGHLVFGSPGTDQGRSGHQDDRKSKVGKAPHRSNLKAKKSRKTVSRVAPRPTRLTECEQAKQKAGSNVSNVSIVSIRGGHVGQEERRG